MFFKQHGPKIRMNRCRYISVQVSEIQRCLRIPIWRAINETEAIIFLNDITIELASFLYIPTLRRKEAWALSPRVRLSPLHAIRNPGWLFHAEVYSAPLLVAIWNCMFYHIVPQNPPKKLQDYHFFLNWYIYIYTVYIISWVNRPSAQKWHLSMSQKPLRFLHWFPVIHWENIIIFWEIRLQKGPQKKTLLGMGWE